MLGAAKNARADRECARNGDALASSAAELVPIDIHMTWAELRPIDDQHLDAAYIGRTKNHVGISVSPGEVLPSPIASAGPPAGWAE